MNGMPSFLNAFCRASRFLSRLHFLFVRKTGFSSVFFRPSKFQVQSLASPDNSPGRLLISIRKTP